VKGRGNTFLICPLLKGLDDMLGNVSLKGLVVAYHAVPNDHHHSHDFIEMAASSTDKFLDTGLARILESSEINGADSDGGARTHTLTHSISHARPRSFLPNYIGYASAYMKDSHEAARVNAAC